MDTDSAVDGSGHSRSAAADEASTVGVYSRLSPLAHSECAATARGQRPSFDRATRRSLRGALRRLRVAFPEADIEAVVDYEGAESAEGDVRIIVRDEFATPAAMLAYEDDVRSLVRSAEIGETMLYTTVERSDGD